MKWLAVVAFALTIPAANWLIGNVGAVCVPDGPCLIPVGFGLMAPSGVLMIGLALVLRDLVQELIGVKGALLAIALGGICPGGRLGFGIPAGRTGRPCSVHALAPPLARFGDHCQRHGRGIHRQRDFPATGVRFA
jgi:hypothetical protein